LRISDGLEVCWEVSFLHSWSHLTSDTLNMLCCTKCYCRLRLFRYYSVWAPCAVCPPYSAKEQLLYLPFPSPIGAKLPPKLRVTSQTQTT
jgi:hypothetical protein